jgi:hypothetical protein
MYSWVLSTAASQLTLNIIVGGLYIGLILLETNQFKYDPSYTICLRYI